jgi:hypothetical protein
MAAERTSFSFPEAAVGALHAIKSRARLENDADVIRVALRSYDDILSIDEAGMDIVVVDKAGEEWNYSPYTKFDHPELARRPVQAAGKKGDAPINFFFTGEAVSRIKSIKERSFLNTNADVIRVALTAYDELITVMTAGGRVVVRNDKGNEAIFSPHRPWRREAIGRAA